ncbi:MAG TPA: hypothetical protein VN381_07730 [Anaerovoracaceae bacterium]|nr:hypothetical protein [Anaerovoracaceae bacterium]
MSNTVKLLTRVLIILALMIIGSWLSGQMILPDFAASITIYAVYLLIGIMLGSMANPRFTKPKNKWIYILPILIFAVIGAMQMLYSPLHVAAWPFGLGDHLLNFSTLAWTITGFFLSLFFR